MGLLVDIKKKLKEFTLEIFLETDGEYLGILGASGSGKSMTFKCIAGIETPDEGKIILNGKVLFDSEKKINLKPQERNVGYLIQNYALFPHMTVEENIGAGLRCPQKEKYSKVAELMGIFNIKGLEKKYPNQLSGGQQQRVALARALIYNPDVLLLDEPFSALDSYLKDKLQTEILELLKLYKGEVLMVTHDRDEAYRLCEKLAIVDKGRIVMNGHTKEIFEQPGIVAAARLTGCKNISPCRILDSNKILAEEWGIVLELQKTIPTDVKYVGIRAHDFILISREEAKKKKNSIQCKTTKIIEDVFEYNISLENGIIYKVKKGEWESKNDNKKIFYLHIPDDAILLLK